MALFGSLLFNRTLKKFLECRDLSSAKGVQLIEKIRAESGSELEKILETIPQIKKPHSDVLKKICRDAINRDSEDRFLDNLDSDQTLIRTSTRNLLSESQQINPSKLFKRLHESEAHKTEIIDILEIQKSVLQPEMYVKNALKLDKSYSTRLFQIALSEAERTDMSALTIDLNSLQNPETKIQLIRYLAAVNKPEAADMISHFLKDSSKIIVIEALKNLKNMTIKFNPAKVAKMIPQMREEDVATAIEIVQQNIDGKTLSSLSVLMTGKSDPLRTMACQIASQHITVDSLKSLLEALEKHEWYGREQAVKSLLNEGSDSMFEAASSLINHESEFVRNAAELLSASQVHATVDLEDMAESVLSENWQVRDRAIEAVGNSKNRAALTLLGRVIKERPESSIAVLKAVANLGFSKGLEIASACLRMSEAAIQREALNTIKAIVNQQHADKVRTGIVSQVSSMQATVRDTAKEVISDITQKFKLPNLNLDEDNLFETRLLKIEENRERGVPDAPIEATQAIDLEKTEIVKHHNIEEIKKGDLWMGRYKVVEEVGRGAMGRVMLVDDETVGEQLILKYMHPELTSDGKARERFLRELKYSRKISHPNVIRIHDFLMHEGIAAISMEFFESYGLDYLLKHDLLGSHNDILKILYQVCAGMWEAHQQNVIHRDLKPSNILVNKDGLAKVVDFGIASVNSDNEATLTKTGMIIGTPAYLSPERAKGLEADHRSDIYALGIIAYALFNGALPYKGEPMSLLFQHIEGKATPLHRQDKGVKVGVSMMVEKMMAVDIEKRYQSMKDVRDTIKELM